MKQVLIDRIRNAKAHKDFAKLGEEATKQSFVLPILQALGWDVFDTREVAPEYDSGGRVDYALQVNAKPKVLIEVKKCAENLDVHEIQLCNYAFQKGVEQAVLTNGLNWWFYLPLEKGEWTDRKVLSVQLIEQDEELIVGRLLELLAKNSISSGESVRMSKNHLKRRRQEIEIADALPEVWNQIISEPDSLLVDLVAESVEKRCGYRPEAVTVEDFIRDLLKAAPHQPSAPFQPGRRKLVKISEQDRIRAPKKNPKMVFKNMRLFGKHYPLNNQREALIIFGKVLHEKEPVKFKEIALKLSGSKRPWFTNKPSVPEWYARIPGTTYFILANLSAKGKLSLMDKILREFGYRGTELKIEAD